MAPDNCCTFYLVRHGETEWNAKKIVQGQSDSPLTPTGEAQTRGLAAELRAIHVDAVFSSDLGRAVHTAEILAREHGLPVRTSPLLRERAFGRYEGQPVDRLPRRDELYPELSGEERFRFKPSPDVESDGEMVNRVLRFVEETVPLYPGRALLVVTHGGLMRVLLKHFGADSHASRAHVRIANGGSIKLVSRGGTLVVAETKGIASSTVQENGDSE